jgi:hypothetical protein
MSIRITSSGQVELLKEGDILQKSAPYRMHQKVFGKSEVEDLVVYEIKSINRKHKTMSLEIKDNKNLFSWPTDLKRTTIKSESLFTDDMWWISN